MSVKFSIVVPAYQENGNIAPLTTRVFAALEGAGYERKACELIIVDDNSRDGSVETVDALKKKGFPVTILVRTKERGLSSAVMHGMDNAKGEFLLCMDADLQHPPEYVPKVFDAIQKPGIEFTLGTRYGHGVAIDKDWPVHRRLISWGARVLARPLTSLSDPMSGFFALRTGVYQRGKPRLSPLGYKIALELFVKCGVRKYNEVGFSFAARTVGASKLTGKVIVHYLFHLKALYWYAFGIAGVLFVLAFVVAALYFAATRVLGVKLLA